MCINEFNILFVDQLKELGRKREKRRGERGREERVCGMKGENGIAQTENEFECIRKSRTAGGRAFAAFFPRFRRYERMHKYTLPVNKISRPRKKDLSTDSLSNVVRYSYAALACHPTASRNHFFLSPLVVGFHFFPPSLSLSFTLSLSLL